MQILHNITDLRTKLDAEYSAGKKIGFVPTMGALHEGHATLAKRSVEENDITVVSIFVNPTQFGPGEDLAKYPRTLNSDAELLGNVGVDIVFAPDTALMYPEGDGEIHLSLRSLSSILCGAKRPGHFDGVLLVVSKLFNLVRPHRAYFGMKDFQQVVVLKTLVKELFFPVEIVECPIIREPDGLAMSSRNRYLTGEERKQALFLYNSLKLTKEMAGPGRYVSDLENAVRQNQLQYPLIRLDYFEVRSADNLRQLEVLNPEDNPVALIAAFCGNTRLIDNLPLMGNPVGK